MMTRIRRALLAVLALAWPLAGAASDLTPAQDLRVEAATATARGAALVVVFSAKHCPYCRVLEDQYLKPMLRSGAWDGRMAVRRIEMDTVSDLRDFSGAPVASDALARRHGIRVTPTILFMDARGNEVAPRLIGIGSEHFFAGMLEDSIDQASGAIRRSVAASRGCPATTVC